MERTIVASHSHGWIDAHCHLDDPRFDADRDTVVANAAVSGMRGFVLAASDIDTWPRLIEIASRYDQPYVLGLHPWWDTPLTPSEHTRYLDKLAATPTPHGIGETGLDYAIARTPEARARQHESTITHIALARARQVPVVLHIVRAYPQLLALLKRHPLPKAGGMIHSWSGAPEFVAPAIRRGLYLSFGASVIHSTRIQQAAACVPDNALLMETDAPDQPVHIGLRGDLIDALQIASKLAQIRGVDLSHILRTTAKNAAALFPKLRGAAPVRSGQKA